MLNAYSLFFYSFASTMEKFLIKKSLIPKDSSSTQDKQDDYNSKPNSSIPQDSCIIIIIFFLFFFCDVIFKFCNEYPKKNSWSRHCSQVTHIGPFFIFSGYKLYEIRQLAHVPLHNACQCFFSCLCSHPWP